MPQNDHQNSGYSGSTMKNLPKPQKRAVLFLFFLAIIVVIFWVVQMRAHINDPFNYDSQTKTSSELDYADALMANDIDGDGLSDYDEMYTYSTSPYLEDSDSDGLSDKQEVEQGTDPNCATGQTCGSSDFTTTSSSTADYINDTLDSSGLDASSAEESALQQVLSGDIDAATLRRLLIESGANQTELEQISDEDLMKSYQETLASQQASSTAQ